MPAANIIETSRGPKEGKHLFLIHASDGSAGIYDPMSKTLGGKFWVTGLEDYSYSTSTVMERSSKAVRVVVAWLWKGC